MDRAERRHRTEKIAKKRFRRLYCNYHGTPEAWLYYRKTKKEVDTLYGMCRSGVRSWSCHCDYCMGRVFLAESIAELNFLEQVQEVEVNFSPPNVLDSGSVGPYDRRHELWQIYVCPWKRCWRNASHHPK